MDIVGFFDLSKQIDFRTDKVFEETTMEYLINNSCEEHYDKELKV